MKKNKHGFTLTELLAVIIVLGLLAILIFPTIKNVIDDSKNDLYESQIKLIKGAAKMWGSDEENKFLLESINDWPYEITLGDLQESGFIEKNIQNPLNDDEIFHENMIIQINKIENYYEYIVIDEINPLAPVITLNGSNIQEVELNGTYTDSGGSAVSKDGNEISLTTTIKKEGAVVETIDTQQVGVYKIIYSATDGENSSYAVRTVKVVDKTLQS